MNLDYQAIGKRIANKRKELHLTQAQLAELAGISASHLGHIEVGTAKPSLQIFVDIANALHVTNDQLLIGELKQSNIVLSVEIANQLKDCSPADTRIILETLSALIHALKNLSN